MHVKYKYLYEYVQNIYHVSFNGYFAFPSSFFCIDTFILSLDSHALSHTPNISINCKLRNTTIKVLIVFLIMSLKASPWSISDLSMQIVIGVIYGM